MFRKIVAICLTTFLYVTANAQDFYDEFRAKSIDVEGIMIDQKINYGQFVAKFGNPDEYERKDTYITGGVYENEENKIGRNGFSFCDGGRFFGFYLSDSRFSALTLWIPGGIRVGDKLSKLDNFKYGKPKVADWMKPTDGSVLYVLFYDYLDGLVFLSAKNGIIEKYGILTLFDVILQMICHGSHFTRTGREA